MAAALLPTLTPDFSPNPTTALLLGFVLTLTAHILARLLGKRIKGMPIVVTALGFVLLFLWLLGWQYQHYYQAIEPTFNRLLGYVTVALAIPLAAMRFDDLPLKKLSGLLGIATLVGALLPMLAAFTLHLSYNTIMAFATRAVTTPIALNIAAMINAPLALANLIIIISGLLGASLSPWLLKGINDDRAKGLALGLAAHAIGTVEAWQISATAGRYAAFGMAVNGMITAIWFPLTYNLFIH